MRWNLFCQVIDNHGDVGVAWRLAVNLAQRGQQVQLYIDDASALAWMAPQGHPGVGVHAWPQVPEAPPDPSADVWVECFGCQIDAFFAPESGAARGHPDCLPGQNVIETKPRLWINLEYLSFEPFALRSHGLESPLRNMPDGWRKFFFYPGPMAGLGGLLHESGLAAAQAGFDRQSFLRSLGVHAGPGDRVVSLFCYEPTQLPALLQQWAAGAHAAGAASTSTSVPAPAGSAPCTHLLVTPGRAAAATRAALQQLAQAGAPGFERGSPATSSNHENGLQGPPSAHGQLCISYLPWLTQTQFDQLLWACDFNLVRGEDSLARALLAGRPFAWHIYPQQDFAHGPKLLAFLDWLGAPASLRAWMLAWNGLDDQGQHAPGALLPGALDLAAWTACAQLARQRVLAQGDLATQLIGFCNARLHPPD